MTSSVRLSEHFELADFLVSDTHPELIKDHQPSPQQVASLTRLCLCVLEPVRVHTGPLRITSGVRTSELVDALIAAGYSASRTSQHLYGEAADVEIVGRDPKRQGPNDLWAGFRACRELPDAWQTILYIGDRGAPSHLHVSTWPVGDWAKNARGLWIQKPGQPLARFAA